MKKKASRGFTLIELIIVILIIGVVSGITYVGLSSRSSVASLERAVQTLAADVAYARSAAVMKRCQTRFILCADSSCTNAAAGLGAVEPRFYAILRRSHNDNLQSCSNPNLVPAANDGYANWDFDMAPKPLPRDVSFDAIYEGTDAWMDMTDWLTLDGSVAAVQNSLYFPTSPSAALPSPGDADGDSTGTRSRLVATPILQSRVAGDDGSILFQLALGDCVDDCPNYWVVLMDSGETVVRRCNPGARGDESDTCF